MTVLPSIQSFPIDFHKEGSLEILLNWWETLAPCWTSRYSKILRRISFGYGKHPNSVFKIDVTEGIVAGFITPTHSTLFDYVLNSKYFQKNCPRTDQTFSHFRWVYYLHIFVPMIPTFAKFSSRITWFCLENSLQFWNRKRKFHQNSSSIASMLWRFFTHFFFAF